MNMATVQRAPELKGFGKKVHDLRKEKDLTQADVAEAIGVDKGNVSGWENGRNTPSLESIIALSKLFGVSADYLIFDNVPREGVEAINDFELYEYFRATEALPTEEKAVIKGVVSAVLFKYNVKRADKEPGQEQAVLKIDVPKHKKEAESLSKVAGKR